ncbi:hypothetical protein ZWY2020_046091 [Hordeum vulgare]|nr:hypothetical protein ZWY2020_046091 [Hordeum vulgare]
MEVLKKITVGSVSIVEELGNMHILRELDIQFERLELVQAFVESLGNMRKIQRVVISAKCEREVSMDLLAGNWVPPPSLRAFTMFKGVSFSTLPAWKPSELSQLSVVAIHVKELQQLDLGFLERLPALRTLGLESDSQRSLLVGAEGFRCLEKVQMTSDSPSQILFQPGALPKVVFVGLDIGLRGAKEVAARSDGNWFDTGMGNLPSLRDVYVRLFRSGVTVGEAKEAKAALENVLHAHPKRPTFHIYFDEHIPEDARDEDVYIKDEESE